MHSHSHKPPTIEPSQLVISVKSVCMRRENRDVLTNVNLDIARGDFLAITGPNGGGKTTLLRIILGLLRPTSGKVLYYNDGQNTDRKPAFGYLPQKNAIDSHFPISVAEVAASGLLTSGFSAEKRKNLVAESLALVEMDELSERPIGQLSGGQLQRALLARAIIRQPEILVLDEPLSYIDKHFEAKLYGIIADLAKRSTILLVSHEMSAISAMANRHIIVDSHLTECCAAKHFIPSDCDE